MADIKHLDDQIEILLSCKPLPEQQVKALCEKVSSILQLHPLSLKTSLSNNRYPQKLRLSESCGEVE